MVNRLLILFIFAVFLWIWTQKGAVRKFGADIGLTTVTYLSLAGISTILSPYFNQSFQWLLVLFSYALLLYVLVSLPLSWNDIVKLLAVLFVMGILEACLSIFQGVQLKVLRPTGTFFNPNFLAGYLVCVWNIALGCLCFFIGKSSWRQWKKIPFSYVPFASLIPVMALFLVAILWTGSRGAILAFLVGTTFVVVARFGFKALSALVLVMGLAILIPNHFRERIQAQHAENPLGYARLQIWQSSINEIMDHPFGIGIGLYQYAYPRYALPIKGQITQYGKVAQTAHNEYLQMAVELGIVSLPIFALGVILIARDAVLILRQRLRRWQRGLIVGIGGSISALLTHAAFDSNLHEPALAVVLTLFVGILISVRRSGERITEFKCLASSRLRVLSFGVAIVIVIVVGVTVVRLGLAWTAYEAGSRALQNRQISLAVEQYQAAIALDPGKALYHSSLGAAHFRAFAQTHNSKAAEMAIYELQTAMKLNPLDGRLPSLLGHVYVNLASVLSKKKSLKDTADNQQRSWLQAARVAYQCAIRLDPFSAVYLLELAKVYDALGDQEAAEAYAKRAIETEPNFLPGRYWLATLYFQTGRTIEADREYREIRERQQRYTGWNKDATELSFLTVDLTSLAAALERGQKI